MKARPKPPGPLHAGYALLMALVFVAVSLIILTSMLQWTSGNTLVTERNNAYNRAVAAAEAATEKVLSQMSRDFVNQNFNPANLGNYRSLVPTGDWATEYEFSNGAGAASQTWVESSPTAVLTNLDSQFAGLYGWVYVCNTRANARPVSTHYPELAAAVRQDFQLASIPIFQFAIYCAMDLEINPIAAKKVNGKVHGNADIYVSPGNAVEFFDTVGAVGRIYHNRHADDPTPSSGVLPVYYSLHQEKVSSLTLPIGPNNSPAAAQQILLDPPPVGENPVSARGKKRYYNKADLVVITTTNEWSTTLNVNGDGTTFTPATTNLWGGTNFTFLRANTFHDYRENKSVLSIDIDVDKFNQWMANNPLGRPLKSIYVDDQRVVPATELAAVRVVNGQTLPNSGLTVATARPLYVKGHFNLNNNDTTVGLTDTSQTKPASLVGDSITILSAGWDDADNPLNNRVAVDTTVNAALLAGIVQTTNTGGVRYYSGGVENFPRLLEDWRNKTLTFNGSMVAMFPSRYATSFWVGPGTYYQPPTRLWSFDVNFLNSNKLPPGTPQVQKLVRGRWSVIAANSPN